MSAIGKSQGNNGSDAVRKHIEFFQADEKAPVTAKDVDAGLAKLPAKEEGFRGTSSSPVEKPSAAVTGGPVAGALRGPMSVRMFGDGHKERAALLTNLATKAAAHAASAGKAYHPILELFGEAVGKALGVIVTEALALVPSWNTPVVDTHGKPVAHVDGADRIGDHDILKRHQEVVGPKITAYVESMAPGAIHDLLQGVGIGATQAPGASYRLEAAVADALR